MGLRAMRFRSLRVHTLARRRRCDSPPDPGVLRRRPVYTLLPRRSWLALRKIHDGPLFSLER
eukprot:2718893-Pleurochrysis_carterae.AAC.1